MIYGMEQSMVQEYLFRSIVRGAVQAETGFIREAWPGALEEDILICKGRFTKVACMTYGTLQNMFQECLFRSILRGTVQSETDLICEALTGAFEENILTCKGLFTKAACMIYGMLQEVIQEYSFRSIVRRAVLSALEEKILIVKGQKLVLVTAPPGCETAPAVRIPVSQPLSRGKVRCPQPRRRQTGSRGTAAQAVLELTLALLLIGCQRAVQPLVQLTVPQGRELTLVKTLPRCETAPAVRIPVSKPLSRGKVPPLLGKSIRDSAPARRTCAGRAASTTSPASCDAAASAGGFATACGRARRAVASSRIWTVT
jgi:hypothetical protein